MQAFIPFYLPSGLCASDCFWVLLSLSFYSTFLSAKTLNAFIISFNADLNSAVGLPKDRGNMDKILSLVDLLCS